MKNPIIAPSILAADFNDLKNELDRCAAGGASMIHFDVMDGRFVKEISFGEPVLRSLSPRCSLPFDVHLMTLCPEDRIDSFAKAGAGGITFHLEAAADPEKLIRTIRAYGIRPAVSLRPATPVETVFPYLDLLDMVLVMTVEPGYGGQSFIPESYGRIERLREEIERRGLDTDIEVDGGIEVNNIRSVRQAGANVFVCGSAVFIGDIESNISALKSALQNDEE